jgi:pimeloyl-ACP methyl ester carboxylesterase
VARVWVVVAAVLALLLGAIWFFQRSLIYFPAVSSGAPRIGVQGGPEAREVELSTADGSTSPRPMWLPATPTVSSYWWQMATAATGCCARRSPTPWSRRGLGVLLFDYRGYGGNAGRPSERGLGYDVRAARDFLVQDLGVRRDRLVYFGESLGTGVITGLAAEHPPAGLVLRSPFVDLASVGRRHYPFLPVRMLLRDRYPVARQLRGVQVPVTVVYGSADSLIPPEESRAVAAAAPNLRELVEVSGAGPQRCIAARRAGAR